MFFVNGRKNATSSFLVEIIARSIYILINFPSDLQNKKKNDFQKKTPKLRTFTRLEKLTGEMLVIMICFSFYNLLADTCSTFCSYYFFLGFGLNVYISTLDGDIFY